MRFTRIAGIVGAVVVAVLIGSAGIVAPASADGPPLEFSSGVLRYRLIDSWNVTVVGFSGDVVSDLVIPSTVSWLGGTFDVKTVAAGAFQDSGISSLAIGDNVGYIGNSAFSGNTFTSVTVPPSVAVIGPDAFAYRDRSRFT